ncbi:hypothetical protein C7B77_15805 [Chamaesiphon polymorphus CCALA 037]|uniref:Type I restriction modification DNA specificity domain-containing protein n=2 Tax=Chamaesiphon TaxID=217161 RepID=A0A2T1GCT5_9CYAN|nr:hypothetical protein C7B77_15805 [Chamaesiphon polymorphus CCALA 037]
MAFNQDIKAVIPDNSLINTEYLAYWMLSSKYHLMSLVESASHGTGRINTSVLKSIKVSCPTLEEQRSIAKILGNFDRKIDNLRKQNETLEEIARSIFKHWFIDFEFPNADGKPYKSSGGVMVRSELGDIPEDWRVGKLGDIASFNNGKSPPERSEEFDIPIYGSNGIIGKANIANYHNIIIIGRVGSYCGSLYYFLGRCWVTDNAMIGKVRNADNHAFLYFILQKIGLNRLSTGSGQPLLNQTILSSIEWILPQNIHIENFEITVKPFFQKMLLNNNQIQTLTKTRDTLLPKLMSGQLRVEV